MPPAGGFNQCQVQFLRLSLRRPRLWYGVPQGRALETIGHAIEYLVDSRMFMSGEPTSKADVEAARILMQASRTVFAECAEVVPLQRQLTQWMIATVSRFHPVSLKNR
jgi:hypothetical protein